MSFRQNFSGCPKMTPENICLSDKISQGVPMTTGNICLIGKAYQNVPKY